ncbi:MAG: cob(I)yrinic acid a,c-diamide adenosyltransferase, partial [Butyrivibrio sp.]|nr:cob(I)yrinic acid a,c-diamide adenosyltransferase [Butyrivibrio sp.]
MENAGNRDEVGLVHLYTGDGKGKTTASIGLLVRAVGAGRKAVFAQFMKG